MNKIYRIVWNHAAGQWMVASELTKGRGKRARVRHAALAVALALPMGGAIAADVCSTDTGTPDAHDTCVPYNNAFSDIGVTGGLDGGVATGTDAIAVGDGSLASGVGSVALGVGSTASGENALAIGHNSVAERDHSVSVGSADNERQITNLAAGTADTDAVNVAQLTAVRIELGDQISDVSNDLTNATRYFKVNSSNGGSDDALARGTDAVAIGARATATATATGAVAIGVDATATTTSTTAIGNGARAAGFGASAIGRLSNATGDQSLAFGSDSKANSAATIAIGEKSSATMTAAMAVGGNAIANGTSSTAFGSSARAIGTGTVAFGRLANAAGQGAVAIGSDAKAQEIFAIAVGRGATSSTNSAIAVGQNSVASGTATIAMGLAAGAAGNQAVAIGGSAQGSGDFSIALGRSANASHTSSVAIGYNSVTDRDNSVSFGAQGAERQLVNVAAGTNDTDAVNLAQLKATGLIADDGQLLNAVVYDDASRSSMSFAGADGTVLKNVADGDVAEDSKHAINGSQLYATNMQIAQNSTNIANIDNRVTSLEDGFNDGSYGLVRQDATSRDITVAAATDGTRVSMAGMSGDRVITGVAAGTDDSDAVNVSQLKAAGLVDADGNTLNAVIYDDAGKGAVSFAGVDGTVLKNVADGEVSEDSKEAVNGSQLHATNEQVAQNTTNISNIDNRVTNIEAGFNEGSIGLVRQDATSRDITVAAATDGTRISMAGTIGDRVITGVAAGINDSDAVNVSQLKAAGLVDADGNTLNAVVYDSDAMDSITLGGKNATQPVKLKNVADATEDDEAVNLAQLKAAGLVDAGGQTLDAVTYDAGSNRGQVTFAGANGTVLTNVADGRIQANSRDAVNGGQIAALRDQLQGQIGDIDNRVTNIEQNGGSGSGGGTENPYFDANGNDTPAHGLPAADAQAGGASAVAAGNGANASGATSVAVGANSEAKGGNSVALGAGSVADRDNTVAVGYQGGERQVTHVAAGVRDTDAVNVSQLNQRLSEAKDYTDQRMDDMWNGVNDRIDSANRQANRGIAGASAMISVTPYLPGKTVLNAGMATYRGESALGVGISRWNDSGRVNVNAGVSAARGDSAIFRVGVGVVLGD